MMLLLIDTSGPVAGVALMEDGKVRYEAMCVNAFTHSQSILPMVEEAYLHTGLSVDDTDYFACVTGPGSFTGVRIGVSAVKGLAFAGDLPCISVSTLESMAENAMATSDAVICCVMDARCQQVYGALFEKDDSGMVHRLTEDTALTVQEMGEKVSSLSRPILLVGDGSEMCYRAWKDTIPNVYLAPASVRYQSAAATAIVAGRHFSDGNTVSAEQLQPIYLRLPQAERELNARMNK